MAERTDQTSQQPTPAWHDVTATDATAHCPTHRAQHQQFQADHAKTLTPRPGRDRHLDLPFSRRALPRPDAAA